MTKNCNTCSAKVKEHHQCKVCTPFYPKLPRCGACGWEMLYNIRVRKGKKFHRDCGPRPFTSDIDGKKEALFKIKPTVRKCGKCGFNALNDPKVIQYHKTCKEPIQTQGNLF